MECAVDSTVYEKVRINGETVSGDRIIEITGNLKDYSSDDSSVEQKPIISFDNYVRDDVIKDLYITKKLYDKNDNEITDDSTGFNFRLYLSSVGVSADNIPLANMYKYYVLSPAPDKKICRYDADKGTFAATSLAYSRENVKAVISHFLTKKTRP